MIIIPLLWNYHRQSTKVKILILNELFHNVRYNHNTDHLPRCRVLLFPSQNVDYEPVFSFSSTVKLLRFKIDGAYETMKFREKTSKLYYKQKIRL